MPTSCLRLSQANVHRLLKSEKCAEALSYNRGAYDERAALRASPKINAAIDKLWTLMVFESARLGVNVVMQQKQGAKGRWRRARAATMRAYQTVTREGYTQMHLRISKVLKASFDLDNAMAIAGVDWAEDITAYSGDSKLNIWLEEVKKKLREATMDVVTTLGWTALFAEYDEDGGGSISPEEFTDSVRIKMHLPEESLSDEMIGQLFADGDADGGGTMDCDEFLAWAQTWAEMVEEHSDASTELASAAGLLLQASNSIVNKIGWVKLFEKYDEDGGGSLEFDEFNTIVRTDCGIKEATVDEAGLRELFSAVDLDGGGDIDVDEFGAFLASDPLAVGMTREVFAESCFQMAQLWVTEPEDAHYAAFLNIILHGIASRDDQVLRGLIFTSGGAYATSSQGSFILRMACPVFSLVCCSDNAATASWRAFQVRSGQDEGREERGGCGHGEGSI